MSLFHFSVTQKSRGAGQSVVSSAAYISGSKLHDDYYGENPDYTRKGGVLYTEIILPEHVPARFSDREFLWNEVENVEKHPKAQLAYSFDIALQNELSFEENLAVAKRFIHENFTARGMIVDMAIHEPDIEEGGISNPHFHVLCPIRPMNMDGTWGAKQHREYTLDENGDRIKNEKGKYVFNAVPTTDWGSPDTLLLWRENWAKLVNETFSQKGITERIDHRSYEEQGINLFPTIHEGPAVRAMEKRGINTDKGDFNRLVHATNRLIQKLCTDIKKLVDNISAMATMLKEIREENAALAAEQNIFITLVNNYYSSRIAGAYSNKAKSNNLQKHMDTINFLSNHSISTFDDLETAIKDLYGRSGELRDNINSLEKEKVKIKNILHRLEQLDENKPFHLEHQKLKSKSTRKADDYYETHRSELSIYHMALREITAEYPDRVVPKNKLLARLEEIDNQIAELYGEYYSLKDDASKAYNIKKSIESEYKRLKNPAEIDKSKKHRKDIEK